MCDNGSLPPVLEKVNHDLGHYEGRDLGLYEGRIKLDPIEEVAEQPKLPSPHMSAPILPPIRPRPVAFKIEGQPTPNTLAAITNNLKNLKSAASFPDESFEPIHLELPKDN